MGRDSPTPTTRLEIDLDALQENLREIRRRVGARKKIIAAVKANAYGHGVVEVARVLAAGGLYALGTGDLEDAVAIRQSGNTARILILGSTLPETVPELLSHALIPSVDRLKTARVVSETADAPSPVFIKVDCGYGRFGVPLEAARTFVEHVATLSNVRVEGVYTHLPFSDAAGRDWARRRHAAFDGLIADLAASGLEIPVTQALSSLGIAGGLTEDSNAVAPGHILYGLNSVAPEVVDMSGFRPALRAITTPLVHVTERTADRPPEADAAYLRHGVTATGTVPLGTNEGYRGAEPQRTAAMLLRGRRVPVLRVCLENTVLDLSAIDGPLPGEEVVAVGPSGVEEITLAEMAEWWGCSPLSALLSFDRRLSRRYTGGGSV